MTFHNYSSLTFIILLWYITFCFSIASGSNSKLSVVTLNIANYDDHPNWKTRINLIVDDLIKANADLIAFQEVRMNPDHPSTKDTFQNQAEQILFELNIKGHYVGAQLVSQPTMYYPFYVPNYEATFLKLRELHNTSVPLPSPWKEHVTSLLEKGEDEGVREFIRQRYSSVGMFTGQYVLPEKQDPSGKSMLWEGSAIISKRRILETGTVFMATPSLCSDKNKRATQYVSVSLESSESSLSPVPNDYNKHPNRFHFFNAHLGLDTTCTASQVQDTTEYMSRFSGPSLLVGDFNGEPQLSAWDHLRDYGLTDVWQHLHNKYDDSKVDVNIELLEKENYSYDIGKKWKSNNPNFDISDETMLVESLLAESQELIDTTRKCQFDGWCTFPSNNPYKRIDYAWANNDLISYASNMRLLGNEGYSKEHGRFAHGGEKNGYSTDGKKIFASDHLGYLIEFDFNPHIKSKVKHMHQDNMNLSPTNR